VKLTRLLLSFDHPRGQRVLSKDSFEVIAGRARVPNQGGCDPRVETVPEESPPHRPGRQVSGDVRQSRELLPQRGHVRSRLPTEFECQRRELVLGAKQLGADPDCVHVEGQVVHVVPQPHRTDVQTDAGNPRRVNSTTPNHP
jgi:hypothetical protein